MQSARVRVRVRALVLLAVFVFAAPTALAEPPERYPIDVAPAGTPNEVPAVIARPPAPIELVESGGGYVAAGGIRARVEPRAATYPAVATEQVSARTEYSTLVANPDGTYSQTVSLGRINYQDAAGAWQPIDVALVSRLVDDYELGTRANDVNLRVSKTLGADHMVELAAGDYRVRIRVPGLARGTVSGAADRLSFTGVGTDPGFEIIPTPEGFQFQVVIADASQASTYHVVIQTVGLKTEATPEGAIWLTTPDGKRVGLISAPTVIDAAGEIAPADAVTTTVADPGAGAIVRDDLPVLDVAPTEPAPTAAAPGPDPSPTPDEATPSASVDPTPAPSDPTVEPTPAPIDPTLEPTATPAPEPTPTIAPAPTPTIAPEPAPDATAGLAPELNVVRVGEIVVTYAIDPAWLTAKERVFPVLVDPSVCVAYGSGTGCQGATGTRDVWISYGQPNYSPTNGPLRVGYDGATYSTTEAELYFPDVELTDGAVVESASLTITTQGGYSNRQLVVAPLNQPWPFGDGTWNNQPGHDTTAALVRTPPGSAGAWAIDISPIVRAWYSRNTATWKANSGVKLYLDDDTRPCGSTDPCYRMYFEAGSTADPGERPKLTINYRVHQARLDFDSSLGTDFAPSTMPVGGTIDLPVTVENLGSGFTFEKCAAGVTTDCHRVGYRWFDATGKLMTFSGATGTADLLANIASGTTSGTIKLPVTVPPTVGQYTLRLDLMWLWDGAAVGTSDYAQPSKYYARVKDPLTYDTSVRWVGDSVIARSEFPIAVVAGGGTGVGETKTVSLPDGSSLGVNLWSQNLRFEGSGGVGFADLATDVGLSYYYDSAFRTDCTSSILAACGWGTNFDEGFLAGANGADWLYRDPDGNRSAVDAAASGQLVGGAGVRLERYRATLVDDNRFPDPQWNTGAADVTWNATSPYVGTRSLTIPSNKSAATKPTAFPAIDLTHYPLLSAALKTSSSAGLGIGFHVNNKSTGTSGWLFYTLGTDFAISGGTKLALGGAVSSWNSTTLFQRNVVTDLAANGFGSSTDRYQLDQLKFVGNGAAGGTAWYDAIRFEGRASTIFTDSQPSWTANGANASLNTADKAQGSASLQIAGVALASSPTCSACLTTTLDTLPFLRWAWKKVGGDELAFVLTFKDLRQGSDGGTGYKTGSLTYYAGPVAPTGAQHPIQVSASVPDHWVYVTRNVLEDARSVLGFYDDHDTSGTSTGPSGGPTPDSVQLTGFSLVGGDGAYALFDHAVLRSIPSNGDSWSLATGDEFAATYPGGITHRFDREGGLTGIRDLDGNETQLVWSYSANGAAEDLTRIVPPGDNDPLTSGSSQREIAVSRGTGYVRFTEQLGIAGGALDGRYTQFTLASVSGGNNVVAVIPARRSASCETSGPSGCLEFAYNGTGSALDRVDDPRDTGSNNLSTSITWVGGGPEVITSNAVGTGPLFRVLDWDADTGWPLRPKYQDANGVASGTNGYSRSDSLTPNGSVLVEYAPVACTAADCATAPLGTDRLVEYLVDGIDNYSTEIRYRTTSNGNPVTTRRGTFAAAKVDNFSDPLTAGLTAWTQTADQYAASVAASDEDLYRTTYTYNEFGQVTHASTPFTNPADDPVTQDIVSVYDDEGHITQQSDAAFVTNPGFESQLDDWTTSGSWTQTQVSSGVGALQLTGSQYAKQEPTLLPGETFRFQASIKAASGASAAYRIDYELPDETFAPLLPTTNDPGTSYHPISYDVTIPADGTGVVKVVFTVGGSGTAYVDNVAVFTRYAGTGYLTNGRVDHTTDSLGRVTKFWYGVRADHPAIFVTTTTANYVSAQPETADQNVESTTDYDVWGRATTTTDPDGVTADTVYAANDTDVATTRDGLDNATTYLYDAIGQRTSVDDPVHPAATTTYTYLGQPLDATAPDGVVTHFTYDAVGRQTAVTANYTNGGSGVTGVTNVKTTQALDQYGNVTRTIADVGGGLGTSDTYTDTTFDLTGQVVTRTVYENSTTGARTTTAYFNTAGKPTGSRGPIIPTAATAPLCPPSGSTKCNSVAVLDMNGRQVQVTDAYGKLTKTWYDFAGKPIREIRNWIDGAYSAGDPDADIVTESRYDTADRIVAVTDVLGRTTSTTYDNLDRIIEITRADSSWIKTVYLPSGRIDRVSRPGAAGWSDTQVGWSKQLYDAAGRQTTTIVDYDPTGAAQFQLDPFEDTDVAGWAADDAMPFIVGGGTVASYNCYGCATGLRAASVTTTAGAAYQGAAWTLAGTFKNGHTYTARVYAKVTTAMTVQAFLGGAWTTGLYGASVSTTLTTSWQPIDVSWTNATGADVTSAYLAIRTTSAQAGAFYLDDAQVWDAATPARHAPTITAFDAASQVIATVAPPGHAGEPPQVTTSAYDSAGRLTSIRLNAIDGAAAANDVNLTTSKAYDALGDLVTETDPSGVATRFAFDRGGRLAATTLNWDGVGLNVTATDNVTSKVGYNDRGEITVICAAGQVQADGCNPATGAGLTYGWRYTYDAAGHTLTDTPPDNVGTDLVSTFYTYDTATGANRLTTACDAVAANCTTPARHTEFTYDDLGRVTSSIIYQGAGTGTPKLRTVTTYDGAGQRTGLDSYENGSPTAADSLTFNHDLLGRETYLKRSGVNLTLTTYNPDGTAASRTDYPVSGTAASFAYDRWGNLLTASSPLYTGNVTYTWRLDGLLDARAWPTGTNAGTLSYDRAKRPTQLAETASGANLAVFSRTYDKNGSVTAETQTITGIGGEAGGGSQTFSLDALRRVTATSFSGGGTQKSYTYDANSNRVTQTEAGKTSTTLYDRTGVARTLTVDGYNASFAKDAYGNLTTSHAPTPVAADPTAPSTPTNLTAAAAGQTRVNLSWSASSDNVAVTSYQISRDGAPVMTVAGTVTAWSDYSLSPGTTYSYTVKALDAGGNASGSSSASQATTQAGSPPPDTTAPSVPTGLAVSAVTSKQLNLAWTASSDNTGVQGYRVYRDGVLIATVGTASFADTTIAAGSGHTYTVAAIDGAGNASAQSSSTNGTAPAPVRTTSYAYDLADRLTGITPAAGPAVTLSLDALGRHLTRASGGITDSYAYAGTSAAIVRISPSSGTALNSALDATGARLAVKTASGAFGWTLADLHADIAGYASSSGAAVTDALRYDPYGEVVAVVASGLPSPWGYQGRLDLAGAGDTDLLDFGFRSYAPDLGTFTGPDDLAGSALNPLSFNRYLYAAANPATLVDPDGHCFQFVLGGLPGVLAAAGCAAVAIGGDTLAAAAVGVGSGTLTALFLTVLAQSEPYDFAYWETVDGPKPMGPPPIVDTATPPIALAPPATGASVDPTPAPGFAPPSIRSESANQPGNIQDIRDGTPRWIEPLDPDPLDYPPDSGDPRVSCAGLRRSVCVSGAAGAVIYILNQIFGPVLSHGPQGSPAKPTPTPKPSSPSKPPVSPTLQIQVPALSTKSQGLLAL
jgi:RHS repeat-associated protein